MSDDGSKELDPSSKKKIVGDISSEATSFPNKHTDLKGRQLTEKDQKERWHFFQEKQEVGSGLSDSDCKLQERGEEPETVTQGPVAERLASRGIQSTVSSSAASNSQTCQVLDQNRNTLTKLPSGDKVFSLNSDQSSFLLSKVSTVSADSGGTPFGAQSCSPSSALPLSSKVSEDLSKLSVISEETTKPESSTYLHGSVISLRTTKQEAAFVPNRVLADRECPQTGNVVDQRRTEAKSPHSSKNGFLPLSSRGEGTLLTFEDDKDDEICDILILFHENDETYLSKFQDICDKYGWTTRTKDDFPLGELGFQQLEEELDKCLLAVVLFSANFLENGLNSHEHQTALMKSIRERSKQFIPIACEKDLILPSYIATMTVGNLHKPSFERQLKKTVSNAKKKHESSRLSLPLNNFDTHQTVHPGKQQGPRSYNPTRSAPCVFRRLQGDLSPGPHAQKFFSDEPFRELCLVLDLADPLGTPYWHKLAEFIGLMQQDIVWLQRQGRCAANVLEVYFCRRSEEYPAVVLSGLMNILEKELDHLQAAGIVRDELSRVLPCPREFLCEQR
ncbi:hypothetical protein HOLleu_26121 [Holothuria leucospilota]|uniref:TIR domain-containing protein n=1 Tax=Holothuria leucospilota TaxID=206669 RepID=A0A9Q1H504_HOLLE|nr:hypothetical protein HOLleu_26121 [Holothuria leucospilota]